MSQKKWIVASIVHIKHGHFALISGPKHRKYSFFTFYEFKYLYISMTYKIPHKYFYIDVKFPSCRQIRAPIPRLYSVIPSRTRTNRENGSEQAARLKRKIY